MSFATARDKIVEIVEAASPSLKMAGSGSRFKHMPSGFEDRLAATRSFFIRSSSGNIHGPLTGITRRRLSMLSLSISYLQSRDLAKLDKVMVSDYEAISDDLLTTSKWDSSNSGIRQISSGGDTLLPYDITDDDDGFVLSITIPMEYE